MTSPLAAKRISALAALAAMYVVFLTPTVSWAVETSLEVAVDRASLMRAPDGTTTVVVGNPMIADATAQRNGVLVVTGKSFGSTNIMTLDANGAVLSETVVSVHRPTDGFVVVQRGSKRETLACNPRCESVVAIGDNPETFGATLGQIGQRNGLSTGARPSE
jgi:Flp pilus assembly secretin CpaC